MSVRVVEKKSDSTNETIRIAIGNRSYDVPINKMQAAVAIYQTNGFDKNEYSDSFNAALDESHGNIKKLNPYTMNENNRLEFDKFLENALISYFDISPEEKDIIEKKESDDSEIAYNVESSHVPSDKTGNAGWNANQDVISSNSEEVINLASSIKLAADQILAYNRQEFGGDSKCPNQESGIINIFLNSCQILLDSITGFSEQIKATAEYFDAMDHELQQALESSFGISGYDITSGGDK